MGTNYTIKIHSPNYVDSELLKNDIDQLLDELNNLQIRLERLEQRTVNNQRKEVSDTAEKPSDDLIQDEVGHHGS